MKRADSGADPDIFDSFFGFGGFGDPFLADIVEAGWLPPAFFEAAGGPGGGNGILAFSVTFIFTDDFGNPTDINNDHYLDTALNEVYYNDNFGAPGPSSAIPGGLTSRFRASMLRPLACTRMATRWDWGTLVRRRRP